MADPGLRPTGDAGDLTTRRADLRNPKWQAVRRSGPLRLGFNSIVAFRDGTPKQAYAKFIDLAVHAESLGYSNASIRVRHFQPNVSGHIALLAAASQHTTAIRLGTAVIPIGYEDVLRLAEELLTLDHLSAHRLEVGLSASAFDEGVKVRWSAGGEKLSKEQQWDKITTLISYIEGEGIPIDDSGSPFGRAAGEPAYVTPAGPSLRDRLYYGSGSLASARRAGELGLSLLGSTLSTEHVGLRFEPAQYEQIAAHRESFASARPPSAVPAVSVSRYIIPTKGAWAERNLGLLDWYFNRFDPSGVPLGSDFPFIHQHPTTGDPGDIAELLAADIALAAADNMTVLVPSELPTAAARELLTIIAEDIAPRFEVAVVEGNGA